MNKSFRQLILGKDLTQKNNLFSKTSFLDWSQTQYISIVRSTLIFKKLKIKESFHDMEPIVVEASLIFALQVWLLSGKSW